jgi:hypothetical protein
MSSTYKVNGVTTIQVDIFDSARYLSTAGYSIEEGGGLPSRMAHFRVLEIRQVFSGCVNGSRMWDDQGEGMVLAYIREPLAGRHPGELVPWSQILDSVPTRCDGFS